MRLQSQGSALERTQGATALLLGTRGGYVYTAHLAHTPTYDVEPNREGVPMAEIGDVGITLLIQL